jgi:hypothetical protein
VASMVDIMVVIIWDTVHYILSTLTPEITSGKELILPLMADMTDQAHFHQAGTKMLVH